MTYRIENLLMDIVGHAWDYVLHYISNSISEIILYLNLHLTPMRIRFGVEKNGFRLEAEE